MGWILEVNRPMNRAMEGMNGRIVSRYRVYERLLAEGAEPAWPADARPWVGREDRRAGLGPDTAPSTG
jgi:hypothetical protein